MCLGEQGWHSSESAWLPPMWPGFDSRTLCHVGWVCCWFSSLLRGFFSGFSGFPPSTKINAFKSNSIWKQWMKSHFVKMRLQIPIYLLFLFLLKAFTVECWLIPSINIIDQHLYWYSMHILINARSMDAWWTLDQQSVDSWSSVYRLICIDQKLIDSHEMLMDCWLSFNRGVNRVPIECIQIKDWLGVSRLALSSRCL